MRRRVGWLALVVALVACAGDPLTPLQALFETSVGQLLEVTLTTTGAGQYGEPTITEPIVRLVSKAVVPAEGAESVRQKYRFQAVAPGRAEIRIPHSTGAWAVIVVDVDPAAPP